MLPPLLHHIVLTLLVGIIAFCVTAAIGTQIWWSRLDRATQDMVWRSRQRSALPKERVVNMYQALRGAWSNDLVLYAVVLVAACCAVAAILLNLNMFATIGLIVGGSLGALLVAARRAAIQSIRAFEKQLLTGINLLITQLDAGHGFRRALERVATVVDDPLQKELRWVVSQLALYVPLPEAFRQLYQKYPIEAMRTLVVALDVNEASSGAKMVPILRSISASLDEEFRLRSEADSEVAQAKYEFNAIIALVVLMWAGALVTDVFRDAIFTPVGLFFSGVAWVNALVGIWRAQRMFAYASGNRRIT